jgi:uncharacterized protein
VVGLPILVAVYALLYAPGRLTRTVVHCRIPTLSREYCLLFVADAHLRVAAERGFRRLARAANWARSAGAEAVLLGGDIVEFDYEAHLIALRIREIFSGLPVMSVLGNHELIAGMRTPARAMRRHRNDPARILSAFRDVGIQSIDDASAEIDGLRLVGLTWRSRLGPTHLGLRCVREGHGPTVVLTHSPDQISGLEARHVDLALCGHTHGGQVRLPKIGTPIRFVRSRAAVAYGVMSFGGVPTFVTSGIGQTIPARLGTFPEAALIQLIPGESSVEVFRYAGSGSVS